MSGLWRPPVTPSERSLRAIRSMQNGSLDGRIVNASRVKPKTIDMDGYDEEEDEEVVADPENPNAGGTGLLPWTDYYRPTTTKLIHDFKLDKMPWVQTKMPSRQNRATVHIYWNGILQTDMSYTLTGRDVSLTDTERLFRAGDEVTVKYFYKAGGSGDPDGDEDNPSGTKTLVYQMNCWLNSTSGENYPNIGRTLVEGGIGSNSGVVAKGTTYKTLKFRGHWTYGIRLPAGQQIPTEDVVSMTWKFFFDGNAEVSLGSLGFHHRGGGVGTRTCRKVCCFLSGAAGCNDCPDLPSSPSQTDASDGAAASPGAEGGVVVATGNKAIGYAQFMNGNRRDLASFTDPTGGSISVGCGIVEELGDHFEDTIWGAFMHITGSYGPIGMTCYVEVKV